jgi:hypothetical protein
VVDEEVVGQRSEVTKENLVACDLCGQYVERSSLIRHAGFADVSEPVEVLHVCEDCHTRIEQEEIPFDEEIAAGLQTGQA